MFFDIGTRALATTIAGIVVTVPAIAQSAGSEVTDEPAASIVVVGARLQSERAVEAKRDIAVVSDSVTGDEAGSLPDFGLGEALDRVPGVSTIQNNARGEAQFITIRGLNADYNLVEVDGVALPTTELGRRNVSLDVIPSALAKRVDVYKTRTPAMDGNAIGGTVNLISRSAFDHKGLFIGGRANAGWYENERDYSDTTPSGLADLTVTNRFGSQNEFGIVLAGSYFRRDSSSLNSSGDNFLFYDEQGRRLSNANAGEYAIAAPNRRRWWTYDNLRQRYGGLAKLEYRGATLQADVTYGDFRHENDEQRQSNSLYVSGDPSVRTPTGGFAPRATAQADLAEFFEKRRISYVNGRLIWRPSDLASLRLGASNAVARYTNDSYLDTYRTVTTDALAYDYIADGLSYQQFTPRNPAYYYNPANYRLVEHGNNLDENRERAFSATIDYDFNQGTNARGVGFAVGGKYRQIDRFYDFVNGLFAPVQAANNLLTGLVSPVQVQPYNGNGDYIIAIDRAAAEARFAANRSNYVEAANSKSANLASDYDLQEHVAAGYMLMSYRDDRFNLSAGARYEHTDLLTGSNTQVGTVWSYERRGQTYDDVLPSLNLSYDVSDTFRVRAAASRSIGRPNYDLLAARQRITEGAASLSITGGNPDLRPRRANNYDVSLEYYFAPRSVLAAAVFAKEINDEIVTLVSTRVEGTGDDEITIRTSQPVNSGRVTIRGIELSVALPNLAIVHPILDGFGVTGNMTFLDGTPLSIEMTDGTMRRLPGLVEQADRIANVTAFYTSNRFSAQVAYNYKSSTLIQISTSATALDRSLDESHVLDAQLRFAITPRISLIAQAKNLTNNRPTRLTGPFQELLREEIDNGRGYFAGVNFRF
ncbi:TonB-dependent receptor [Blastomonas aquatica]|uniref:TonB-dependent receptor n=1 Tax=Blastomonas aquatica TaxID=1510276 RepID=A0ABQ1JMA6_9SPHN|nr:TonB-dependent receptor [Blastomonas aquatica]GGB71913.1 TonB-dependent receptor [Blastomonas aquatica]